MGLPLGVIVWQGLLQKTFWPDWAKGYVGLLFWIFMAVVAVYGIVRDVDARLRRNIGTIGE